jgi:ribosomal protein S18 acetylase RimI-like enzyme
MYTQHKKAYAKHTKNYPPNTFWYIEVVCVKPSAQGRGVGKVLLEWIINEAEGAPCFLESTTEKNVAFYEKYGFKLVEVGEMVDDTSEKGLLKLYYMIRDVGGK